MTASCYRRKDSQGAWPRPEALAKRASAIQTHSSVRTENRAEFEEQRLLGFHQIRPASLKLK